MIKIEELRIGNWVFDQDCEPYYFQIEQIRKDIGDSLWVYYRNGSIKCKVPEPIPLTEEILLKCGFEKQGFYFLNRNSALMQMEISLSRKCFISSLLAIEIKHLHQLQNLYFCLVGKELNIEL